VTLPGVKFVGSKVPQIKMAGNAGQVKFLLRNDRNLPLHKSKALVDYRPERLNVREISQAAT